MVSSARISELKQALADHPLYQQVETPVALRLFMQSHVFCVWDFMSLLKSLQLKLTGMSIPWLPKQHSELARLINEIVLDEETDIIDGKTLSHFQLYFQAMAETGCDLDPIRSFISAIHNGFEVADAMQIIGAPQAVRQFVMTTFEILEQPIEVQAAVFFHAREDIIPPMFIKMVKNLQENGLNCDSFLKYLERHIHLDSETHGPRAQALLDALIDESPDVEPAIANAVEKALQARLQLWDFLTMLASIPQEELAIA